LSDLRGRARPSVSDINVPQGELMAKQLFVNLPVKDLKRSVEFFTKLGFTFNPQFTDENGTCMIISENIFAMLLAEPFFKTFIKKEISDATKTTEVLLALSVDNRAQVEELIGKAKSAGATLPTEPKDYGFMYQHGFQDLDGHLWEVFYMDEKAMAAQQQQQKQ
jgi:predicted lactoylglutathione lyase